jgi:hypothetical protein
MVVVYNSFLISNQNRITVSDLSLGPESIALEGAYPAFVEDQASVTSTTSDDQRKLTVIGAVPSSSQIYLIEDSTCPNGAKDGVVCQTVFGSFDLIALNEADPQALSESMSASIQSSIDSGELQAALSRIDGGALLQVERSSLPVTGSRSSSSNFCPSCI